MPGSLRLGTAYLDYSERARSEEVSTIYGHGVEGKSVRQENASGRIVSRARLPGGHIYLGNPVLPGYTVRRPQDQVSAL